MFYVRLFLTQTLVERCRDASLQQHPGNGQVKYVAPLPLTKWTLLIKGCSQRSPKEPILKSYQINIYWSHTCLADVIEGVVKCHWFGKNCHCFWAELCEVLCVGVGGASWSVQLRKWCPHQSPAIGGPLILPNEWADHAYSIS